MNQRKLNCLLPLGNFEAESVLCDRSVLAVSTSGSVITSQLNFFQNLCFFKWFSVKSQLTIEFQLIFFLITVISGWN